MISYLAINDMLAPWSAPPFLYTCEDDHIGGRGKENKQLQIYWYCQVFCVKFLSANF